MVDYHKPDLSPSERYGRHAKLRKKYPKWAHRRDHHEKKRRRSRSRSRRRRRRAARQKRQAAVGTGTVTNGLLMQLLHQIMGTNIRPLARKHGENVLTGYANAVTPGRLAPVRARDEYSAAAMEVARTALVTAVGAAAHAGGAPHA